jgi:hypothetical protein
LNQFHERPILPLNQGGLRAINSAIIGYLPLLKRRHPVPSDTIQKFQSIRLKLAPLLKEDGFPEGTVLALSQEELRLIEEALRGFIAGIRHHFASSTQQEALLQELEALHQCVRSYLIQDLN